MTIPRILVVALAVFFECHSPQELMSGELPRLSGMVTDFRSSLKVGYVKDLEVRLKRFHQRNGYALVVVVIPSGEDERISDLISQLFVRNGLEKWGLAGTVLSFVVGALVRGLKPFWFTDTVCGRKPGEKIHPPFFGRG